MNPYEITFIVRPDLDEEQTRATITQVNDRIGALGGEIIATYQWNPPRRRMAYPIRDFGDGYYITSTFRFAGDALPEFERGLRLNTAVLRFLLVQATDLNIQQSEQRAQQAAARAAAPPPLPPGATPPAAVAPEAGAPLEAPSDPGTESPPAAEVATPEETPAPDAVPVTAEAETPGTEEASPTETPQEPTPVGTAASTAEAEE